MRLLAWGAIDGVVLGLGLWAMIAALPRMRRPRLEARLAPYLLDVSVEARAELDRTGDGIPLLRALFGPAGERLRDSVLRRIGSEASIALRLRLAGSGLSVDGFRALQLVGAAVGAVGGVGLAAAIARAREVPAPGWLALVAFCALGAYGLGDVLLSRAAARRRTRIVDEFPTVAELLALSLSAGEGGFDAIRRVATASSGGLGAELRSVVADVELGVGLADALQRMSKALRIRRLELFADAVTGALERGAPLAEVLRAQAGDARSERKRELMELAGRKEVLMLMPLIFGLLPLTILIAVFPGVYILQAGL